MTLYNCSFLKRALCMGLLFISAAVHAQNNDYVYDIDGNLTKDKNKGWDSIYYNHLNLIERVDLYDGRQVHYSYDALGKKLSKTVKDNRGNERTTYYVGGFQYEQPAPDSATTLERLSHEEGWLTPEEEDAAAFSYAYNLQDHLGNNRVSFTEEATAAVSMSSTAGNLVPRIIQTAGFYPFGGIWEGSQFVSSIKKNLYLLIGKEEQEELGVVDFGARMLHAFIGRWFNIDPLAEKFYRWSPYNYVLNNPLRFVDPDGRAARALGYNEEQRKEAREAIVSTVRKEEVPYMQFDEDGYLSEEKWNEGRKNLKDHSEVFLVWGDFIKQKKATFNVLVANKTKARWPNGDIKEYEMDLKKEAGYTLMPSGIAARENVISSPSEEDVFLVVSKIYKGRRRARLLGHEMGHGEAINYNLNGQFITVGHPKYIDKDGKLVSDNSASTTSNSFTRILEEEAEQNFDTQQQKKK